MNIALLTAEYPPQPGGVGDYTHCLAAALDGRGHTVTIITGGDKQRLEMRDWRFTSSHQSPISNLQSPVSNLQYPWNFHCWRDTIATLDALRPDVLHIQYQTGAYGMHPAINLLPWRLRGLPGRPKVVVTFHDLLEPYLFPKAALLRRWVTLRLTRDADAVLVTNEEDAYQLQGAGRRLALRPVTIPIGSNIPVAPPPGYNRAQWRERLGIGVDEFLVAYFGLLSHSKGADLLLDAVSNIPRPRRLVIIGGEATAPQDQAYAATILAQIERSKLRDQTIITGHVEAATVSAHLLAADCVALPFRDGASFRRGSLLAALTHGCPTITTSNQRQTIDPPWSPSHSLSSILPRLINGENVLLIPPDNSTALAAALRRLANDIGLRHRLSSGARDIGAQFSWDMIVGRHEHMYKQL